MYPLLTLSGGHTFPCVAGKLIEMIEYGNNVTAMLSILYVYLDSIWDMRPGT